MRRVKDLNGIVHFLGYGKCGLCGKIESDLLGAVIKMNDTSDSVTCPHCATLYCRIKNAPWNEVEEKTLDNAMYDAEKLPC